MTEQPPASPPGGTPDPPVPPAHVAGAQAAAPPRPAPAAPKVEVPAKSPDEMISTVLRSFLEARLREGSPVTVDVGKTSFTGRIFRLMLHEGWIAVEHVDGRRRAFFVYEAGSISGPDGSTIAFGAAAH